MLEKIRSILNTELPISIEEKITRFNNGSKEVEYKTLTKSIGASYYWLVKFTNGQRIPYPILNLEGVESSPFENGEIEKNEEEIALITEQEKIVKDAFTNRPELKQCFEKLQESIFDQEEYIYSRCSGCACWAYSAGEGYCISPQCETMPEGKGTEVFPGKIAQEVWNNQMDADIWGQIPVFDYEKRIVRNAKTYEEAMGK